MYCCFFFFFWLYGKINSESGKNICFLQQIEIAETKQSTLGLNSGLSSDF